LFELTDNRITIKEVIKSGRRIKDKR